MTDKPITSTLPNTVELAFCPGGDPEASRTLEAWAVGLEEESGGMVRMVRRIPAKMVHLPAVNIRGLGRSEISYHFVPKGPEDEAFHELLWNKARQETNEKSHAPECHPPPESLEFLLFVANQCPNCPRTVRTIHSLALDTEVPPLSVHLFDATMSPDLAERHHVKSVPTLIIQDRYRLVGTLDTGKLRSLLRAGTWEAFLYEQIRQQIREGEAPEAGRTIAAMDDLSFLLEDLGTSTFQERVGWLLALEEALEVRPGCLDPLVQGIVSLLDKAETAVRGDLADLLGKIGHPDALPALERLRQDPNPDVVEFAADAIDEIRGRIRPSPGTESDFERNSQR